MKGVTWVKRPYAYIIIGVTFAVAVGLLETQKIFEIDIIDIAGLRLLAISLSTGAGILIGLVAATIMSIVRISNSQKQFYQGVLASERQWLKNWFATHPTVVSQLRNEIKDVLYAIYRHSTIAAVSDDELLEKVGNTLLPLPDKWRELNDVNPNECHLEQDEVDEFEVHVHGIGATVGQIAASKDRMQVGAHLGDVLWTLGSVFLIGLVVIVLCTIPNPPKFIGETASLLALALIEIAFISVFFTIFIVTQYLRVEVKEMARIYRITLSKHELTT